MVSFEVHPPMSLRRRGEYDDKDDERRRWAEREKEIGRENRNSLADGQATFRDRARSSLFHVSWRLHTRRTGEREKERGREKHGCERRIVVVTSPRGAIPSVSSRRYFRLTRCASPVAVKSKMTKLLSLARAQTTRTSSGSR